MSGTGQALEDSVLMQEKKKALGDSCGAASYAGLASSRHVRANMSTLASIPVMQRRKPGEKAFKQHYLMRASGPAVDDDDVNNPRVSPYKIRALITRLKATCTWTSRPIK